MKVCISEARVRDLWNIVEMFVEPFRILCVKKATLSLYTFSNLRILKRLWYGVALSVQWAKNMLRAHLFCLVKILRKLVLHVLPQAMVA